jgi:MFS family permease
MQNVATGWLMTSLNSSPFWVALVQVAMSLPVFLIALPAGALADLVDRRKFLLITQSSMVVASGALGILTVTGAMTPHLLVVFTFLLGVGANMNDPAWQALTPDLVPAPKLASAVALNSAAFNIARAVGPALGGLVIATWDSGTAFLLNAFSFFGVIFFLYRWKPAVRELPTRTGSLYQAIGDGIRYAGQDPRMKAVLVRTLSFSVLSSAYWAMVPLMAVGYGAKGYGAILACFGLGAFCGAGVLSLTRGHWSYDAVVRAATFIFALAMFFMVRTQTLAVFALLAAAAGLAWISNLASLNFVAQTTSPVWVRARMISLYVLALHGGLALGSLIWGSLATRMGLKFTLTTAACALCATLLLSHWYKLQEQNLNLKFEI